MEIQNHLSYEVQVDGDTVIVPGSNLKSMRSKEGYYRMVYRDKLFVLHGSEIRELDRTENVVSDDDELLQNFNPQQRFGVKPPDLPSGHPSRNPHIQSMPHHIPQPASHPLRSNTEAHHSPHVQPPYQNTSTHSPYNTTHQAPQPTQNSRDDMQIQKYLEPTKHLKSFDRWYDVKLHGTWVRLHQSSVTPSKDHPGFYSVNYQGRTNYVEAINVVPLELGNSLYQQPQNAHNTNYQQKPTHVKPTSPKVDPAPAVNTAIVDDLNLQSLSVKERRAKIRRDSYTVKKGVQEYTGKVKVFVGGEWKVYNKRELKPSKKQPGTFILKLPNKSVRLSSQHIKDIPRDNVPVVKYRLFQIFLNRRYVNVSADDIEDAPKKPGYKVVSYNGVKQLLHQNFIFPMKEIRQNEFIPIIPDFFKVYLTPTGVVVPKENIKPDEEINNTFMVLWNKVIYKVSAEQVEPVKDETEEKEDASTGKVKKEEKKVPKIPVRPKGKFPNRPGAETKSSKLCKKKGSFTYRVRINGVSNLIPSHNVIRDVTKAGTYRVYHNDKWIQVDEKYVSLSTKANSKESISSKGKLFSTTSNSPFRSPLPWDKRLRNSSNMKKNVPLRPRWRNSKGSSMPSMTTSKKLHYKKLMVPSQHEDGKFEIETNPDNLVSLISSENATPSMESQKISQNLESAKPLSSTSANTGMDSSDTFADNASVMTSTTVASSQPFIPGHRGRRRTSSSPGLPVLYNTAITSGPDARTNIEWMKTLRC